VSRIQELVWGKVGDHPEVVPIEEGFQWQRGDDATNLWFEPRHGPDHDSKLSGVACIETIFGPRFSAPGADDLARLNRRACFGNYFSANGRLRMRASYCIYDNEPAAEWVAFALMRAMGEQLSLGAAVAYSEFDPASLAVNRANLVYPRSWASPPDASTFESTAATFRQSGFISTPGPRGMVLEVPMASGGGSRMLTPGAETALLRVSTDVPHPIAGVGYSATIALPFDPASGGIAAWCKDLNAAEHTLQDFVPRLGAWGMRSLDKELVYSVFWPTDKADEGLPFTIMTWMIHRTLWIRSTYWAAGSGLAKSGGR
jgi:hypothetical protein